MIETLKLAKYATFLQPLILLNPQSPKNVPKCEFIGTSLSTYIESGEESSITECGSRLSYTRLSWIPIKVHKVCVFDINIKISQLIEV